MGRISYGAKQARKSTQWTCGTDQEVLLILACKISYTVIVVIIATLMGCDFDIQW